MTNKNKIPWNKDDDTRLAQTDSIATLAIPYLA